jgi:hypothetical protein
VFRELLQNSDDAGARSVEIRFETEEYLSREKGDEPQSDESKQDLPDLKTAVACGFLSLNLIGVLSRPYDYSHRSTNGRSRITAYYSEMRTGIDSRRLVPKHFRLSLSPSYVSLADGNPDEKKIGAFGVGGSRNYIQTTGFLTCGVYRLLQLVLDNR